jgi:2-dehydro-3-deoxyphosphooctonate aldolase (KDO 8-P synthase)
MVSTLRLVDTIIVELGKFRDPAVDVNPARIEAFAPESRIEHTKIGRRAGDRRKPAVLLARSASRRLSCGSARNDETVYRSSLRSPLGPAWGLTWVSSQESHLPGLAARAGTPGPDRRIEEFQVLTGPNAVVEVGQSARPAIFGARERLSVIAGPCQMESRQHALETAGALREIADRLKIGLVYKTSFDKANRTSGTTARGMGLSQALPIFAEIRETTGLPVLTDVHDAGQCADVAEAVDVLQIPAFLCRQTDLIVAAAQTGRTLNIKKGQFLAPWDMQHVVAKATAAGNPNVLACERGVSFGYNTLVSDMRALPILAEIGCPVIFDATHSVQQPGGQGAQSGGERRFVPVLARAAVAIGVAGVFLETHPDPDRAPSDGPNMVPLAQLEGLLAELLELDAIAKRRES